MIGGSVGWLVDRAFTRSVDRAVIALLCRSLGDCTVGPLSVRSLARSLGRSLRPRALTRSLGRSLRPRALTRSIAIALLIAGIALSIAGDRSVHELRARPLGCSVGHRVRARSGPRALTRSVVIAPSIVLTPRIDVDVNASQLSLIKRCPIKTIYFYSSIPKMHCPSSASLPS